MKRARYCVQMMLALLVLCVTAAHGGTVFEFEIWCPDMNGDLVVDDHEVGVVLDNWGPCPASDECIADINENGEVGTTDLLRIYGNLGPCRCEGDLHGNGDRDATDADFLDILIDLDLDCRPDLDHSGTVDRYDEAIVRISKDNDIDSDPRADVDEDGDVDADDLQQVRDALGRNCKAELTGDGNIDALDRLILVHVANFSDSTCP